MMGGAAFRAHALCHDGQPHPRLKNKGASRPRTEAEVQMNLNSLNRLPCVSYESSRD